MRYWVTIDICKEGVRDHVARRFRNSHFAEEHGVIPCVESRDAYRFKYAFDMENADATFSAGLEHKLAIHVNELREIIPRRRILLSAMNEYDKNTRLHIEINLDIKFRPIERWEQKPYPRLSPPSKCLHRITGPAVLGGDYVGWYLNGHGVPSFAEVLTNGEAGAGRYMEQNPHTGWVIDLLIRGKAIEASPELAENLRLFGDMETWLSTK